MANEPREVILFGSNGNGDAIGYTCASGTTIPKRSFLVLTGDDTVTAHSASGQICVGVASIEKSSSDTSTSISAWQNALIYAYASGAVVRGQRVKLDTVPNYVRGLVLSETSSNALAFATARTSVADGARVLLRMNI